MHNLTAGMASMPYSLGGCVLGVAAFGVLMLALYPVFMRQKQPRLLWGFLATGASFGLLALGAGVVYATAASAVLTFLVGELVGLFACWGLLGGVVLMRSRTRRRH